MNLLKTIIIFILIIAGIYFVYGCEHPTELKPYHVNISGVWESDNIDLRITQNGKDLTGFAVVDSREYDLIGNNDNTDDIFMHFVTENKEIFFTGKLEMYHAKNVLHAFPNKINGRLQIGREFYPITLNKVSKWAKQ